MNQSLKPNEVIMLTDLDGVKDIYIIQQSNNDDGTITLQLVKV